MEEHRVTVFENRVLRMFGPKRDDLTGGCGKLHNEELYNLFNMGAEKYMQSFS